MEIIKLDASEYGLEENKAQQIADQFKPMLDKMVELEKEANEVFKLDKNDKETSLKAKEVRLKYVKVRTGTAEIHKQQKSFYLQAGRYVDGWKNAQLFAGQGVEDMLMSYEKHAEIQEQNRRNAIKEERAALLAPYDVENVESLGLSLMSEDVWTNFLESTKKAYEDKINAEAIAEKERIEKERLEKEEKDKLEKENEELRKQAEEREKADKLAKEKEGKEIQDKKDAEEKAEKERLEAIQAELNKGDAAKITDLINDLNALKTKYEFKSVKNKGKYSNVGGLIDKVVNYIKE